jgi:3-oxoacyl-[acyl-carrier protein] reductase
MSELDFNGKVAIVTGASRGIGRAIAEALARRNASVVGTARSLDSSPGSSTLQQTVDSIERLGGACLAVPADITEEAGALAVVEGAMRAFGRVDMLVNNAGVYPVGTIAGFSLEQWRQAFSVNVDAPFLMAHTVLPIMMEQGSGNILNVTSAAAQMYMPGRVANSTTKAALNRFSINLAEEVRASGIAVNAWGPGLTRTDMTEFNPDGVEPEAVVESAMWLLAQDADSFTGQIVRRAEFGETWGPR